LKKIVIGGSSPSATKNTGDEAMLSNFCTEMSRIFPDCEITTLVRHPSHKFDRLFGVHSIRNFDHDTKKQSLGKWFKGFNPEDNGDNLIKIRNAIQECDLLVIGGGPFEEIFKDDFLRGVASYTTLLATLAILYQKPYVIYGLIQPPIHLAYNKQQAKFVCENAALVSIRQEYSKKQLLDVGINGDNFEVLTDPVHGLQPALPSEQSYEILKKENIELGSNKIVGVTLRHIYWKGDETEFEYQISKLASLCDFMIDNLDVCILFIPQQTYNVDMPNEDDRVIAERVWNKIKFNNKAFMIKQEHSLYDILSIFPLLDMMVTNRLHTCNFAAIHHIPMIALVTEGNEWKLEPLLDSLTLPQQTVNFINETQEALENKIQKTWNNRSKISNTLSMIVPSLRKKARQHADLFAEFIS
jgi:polysaccharide pyruvyl transferase WcaK-like protein